MSFETVCRLSRLRAECVRLGIWMEARPKRKERREDYIRALRNYYLGIRYPDGIPWSLSRIMQVDCPMLCRRYHNLNRRDQVTMWKSGQWIVEEKVDGCRCLVVYDSDTKSFSYYSRFISDSDFLPVSFTDNLPSILFEYDKSFIIDTEVVSVNPDLPLELRGRGILSSSQSESVTALLHTDPDVSLEVQEEFPLQFIVFDCLYHGKKLEDPWIVNESYKFRRNVLASLPLPSNFVKNRIVREGKEDFYEKVIREGGEGIVFKNTKSPYITTSSRPRTGWVKLKGSPKDTVSKDIDSWISGYFEEVPDSGSEPYGVLCFSVVIRRSDGSEVIHEIGRVSNLSSEMLEAVTVKSESGSRSLNPEYLGRVATISGSGVSHEHLRLTQCTLETLRPDKSPHDCEILEESELMKLVL